MIACPTSPPGESAAFVIDEAFMADPYPPCAALRERGPVHRVRTPDGLAAWLVVDHVWVVRALEDPRLSTDAAHSNGREYRGLPLPAALRNDLLHLDPPRHTRLRRMVAHAFTKRAALALRPRVEREAHRLLDRLPRRRPVDLLAELALPLTLSVICDLIGLDPVGRDTVAEWTDTLLVPQGHERISRALRDAEGQLRDQVRRKRRHPADDLLSVLVQARDGAGLLSEDELVSLCFVLVAAGHDTTASALCSGLLALLHPRTGWIRLQRHRELLPGAIEELLRYDGPLAMAIRRFPMVDVTLGGTRVRAGETVLLSLAAAGRDPEVFADPDRLDLTRAPNPHLAFGRGRHICPGMPLARLQAEIVLTALADRFPGLALAEPPERLTWRPSHRTRRLERLPVLLGGPDRERPAL